MAATRGQQFVAEEGCDYGRNTRWAIGVIGGVLLSIMAVLVSLTLTARDVAQNEADKAERKLTSRIEKTEQTLAAVTELSTRIDERLKAIDYKIDALNQRSAK